MSSGSMAGNMAMRSWLRPSLRRARCRRCHWTAAPWRPPRRRSRPRSRWSRPRGCGPTARHEGLGEVRALGPRIEDLGRAVAAARRPLETAAAVQPVELLGEQEDGGECGRVVRLVEPGIVEGDLESKKAGTQRPDAEMRSMRSVARERGAPPRGRRRRRSTSAGQVVGVELGGVDPQASRSRGGVDRHQAAAVGGSAAPFGPTDLHGHAVEVSLWVRAYRSIDSSATGKGGCRHRRSARRGPPDAERPWRTRRTWRRTRRRTGAGSCARSAEGRASQKHVCRRCRGRLHSLRAGRTARSGRRGGARPRT